MAEFSEEYIKQQDWKMDADFSINRVYNKLKEGETSIAICEGFGFSGILREDNTCKLIYQSGEVKTLEEILIKV